MVELPGSRTVRREDLLRRKSRAHRREPALESVHPRSLLFFFTLQNELTPNHAKASVKPTAIRTRPAVARPASYFSYSRASAKAPNTAMDRNTAPVTSSHNTCATCPNDRAVARAPCRTAFQTRPRAACSVNSCPATRVAAPNFRAAEMWFTASILTASGATMAQLSRGGEPFPRPEHPKSVAVARPGGPSGSAT
jgi:hypothetical protein